MSLIRASSASISIFALDEINHRHHYFYGSISGSGSGGGMRWPM